MPLTIGTIHIKMQFIT